MAGLKPGVDSRNVSKKETAMGTVRSENPAGETDCKTGMTLFTEGGAWQSEKAGPGVFIDAPSTGGPQHGPVHAQAPAAQQQFGCAPASSS